MKELVVKKDGFPSVESYLEKAEFFAKSDFLPVEYRDNPANCAIAMDIAARSGASLPAVAQNLVIVHGRPTFLTKFLIAQLHASRATASRINYEVGRDEAHGAWCVAFVQMHDGSVIRGTRVTMLMAEKEGWKSRKGSKWQTMPEQMLKWRAAAFLINQHFPEIGLGIGVAEEVEDATPASPGATWPRRMVDDDGALGPWVDITGELFDAAAHIPPDPPAVIPPVGVDGAFLPLPASEA